MPVACLAPSSILSPWGILAPSTERRRMESLTESEIAEIVTLQRDEGVQRLSCHFSWEEFEDHRRTLHQEFVYDVAVFTANRGFSWTNVIQAAGAAKSIFPQLHDLDAQKLLSLFQDLLPTLTPLQQHQLTEYLINTLVARRRLLSAVVERAPEALIFYLQLDVPLPPLPRPLAEGMDLKEWQAQQDEAQKESEELLKDTGVSNDKITKESTRPTRKTAEGQKTDVTKQDVNQSSDNPSLKQQQAGSATRGRQSKAKQPSAKTKKS